jgi:hypothetical protein
MRVIITSDDCTGVKIRAPRQNERASGEWENKITDGVKMSGGETAREKEKRIGTCTGGSHF